MVEETSEYVVSTVNAPLRTSCKQEILHIDKAIPWLKSYPKSDLVINQNPFTDGLTKVFFYLTMHNKIELNKKSLKKKKKIKPIFMLLTVY